MEQGFFASIFPSPKLTEESVDLQRSCARAGGVSWYPEQCVHAGLLPWDKGDKSCFEQVMGDWGSPLPRGVRFDPTRDPRMTRRLSESGGGGGGGSLPANMCYGHLRLFLTG